MAVRKRRRWVETTSYLAFVGRAIQGAAARVGEGDVEELRSLIQLRADLDDAIVEAVRGLREAGHTWEQIGSATGTTRQAAIMKWSRLM